MSRLVQTLALLTAMVWFVASCSIEESEQGLAGSISVFLTDSAGVPIEGAEIHLDGVLKSQRTQLSHVILSGIPVGMHELRLFRPGYRAAIDTVEVQFRQTTIVALSTTVAPPGVIELQGVPDSTALLLNGLQVGLTPPTHFSVGSGSYRISAYLSGHATESPANWFDNVIAGDTVRIAPAFTPVTVGSQVGQLAPPFQLPDDLDSALFRVQDQRGLVTVMTFFFYNCTPCLDEFPYFQAVYSDPLIAGRVQFFGIDPQDPYSIFRTYREDHPTLGLTFPLLWANEPLRNSYGVLLYPTNFVLDKTGRIRYRLGSLTEAVLRDAVETLLAEE